MGESRRATSVVAVLVAVAVAAGSTVIGIAAPPVASATGVLGFVDPVTDNYKTWHPRTGADNRTSMLFSGVTVDGQTYVVPNSVRTSNGNSLGAPTEWHGTGGIPLATSPGGPIVARLRFDHDGLNAYSYFRLWPDGTFGPLMTINRSQFVASPHPPVSGTFTLRTTEGATLATSVVSYRYDAGIAALPEVSSEWNGPLGRWHAAPGTAAPTPLNWPAAIAIAGQPEGTHQPTVNLPSGTASTLYVAAVDIAGLPIPRVDSPIALAWTPAGAGRPTSATGTAAWRPVTVTLNQGSYSLQATGTCESACRFDFTSQPMTSASSSVVAAPPSAPAPRPDAAIRLAGQAWTGEGVVNTSAAGQSISVAIPVGSSRDFDVKVTNAGNLVDSFGLADARAGAHTAFSYTWRYQGAEVTSQVHDDGWFVLPDVPVGATRTLQLTVSANPNAVIGTSASYALHAYHVPASAQIKDVVAVQLTTAPADVGSGGDYVRPPGAPEVPIQPCSRFAAPAPAGNDGNPGTKASPVLSLNRLTSLLSAGQTGCLADGTEIVLPATGGLGIMSGGSPGQPKIVRPETPGARATVRGLGKFLVNANQSDLMISHVDFRGALDQGGGNLVQINGDRVVLDGVSITWPRNICLGVGSSADPAEDFVLIDSRIHDCGSTHVNNPADPGGAHGAYLQYVRDGSDADSWGGIIYNTLFDHNDARGLQLFPDVDGVLVDHVVLYGNGSNLNIGAESATVRSEGIRVQNSILANSRLDFDAVVNPNPTSTNDVVGYFPGGGHNGASNRIVDSCLSNTFRPGLLFAVTSNGNSLARENVTENQPPTFVNVATRDFRLTSGSSCQGRGLADISKLPLNLPTGLIGTVTESGTGAAIPNAWVVIMRTSNLSVAAGAVTDASGAYTATVPPGTYYVYLVDPSGDRTSGFFGPPTTVTVNSGTTTVDPVLARRRGGISGTITDTVSGAPISGALGLTLTSGGVFERGVVANGAGQYDISGLAAGNHFVGFVDPTGNHAARFFPNSPNVPSATTVSVTSGANTTANGSLPTQAGSGTGSTLSGTVTQTGTGAALTGAWVVALNAADYRLARIATTNGSGGYSMSLGAGLYMLAFIDPMGLHAQEWHDNRPPAGLGDATAVSVPNTVNAQLDRTTGSITGTVTADPGPTALGGIWVLAIGPSGPAGGAVTAGNGTYTIAGVPAGTYRLAFVDPAGIRATEYFDNSATFDGSTPFAVPAGGSTTRNATLALA